MRVRRIILTFAAATALHSTAAEIDAAKAGKEDACRVLLEQGEAEARETA